MAGQFKLKNKFKLSDLKDTDVIPESDFATVTPDGYFVQLEYKQVEESKKPKYDVKPGIWSIQKTMAGMHLQETSYVSDKILKEFVNTKAVVERILAFFNKIDVYKEFGIEVPKRGGLAYGPAGSGKSTIIAEVSKELTRTNDTAVIIWPTDKYEAYEIKDFIQTFDYKGVSKLIFVVEDIGGIEMDQVRMKSDSSLLSLLDNQEKTFKIATYIIATTNFPEALMANLTNRPGRFDDKFEVGYPPASARVELLKFFSKNRATDAQLELIQRKEYNEFNPAHIKEAFIRSAIYDKSLEDVLRDMKAEIDLYKKAFTKSKTGGFGLTGRDE